MSNCNSDDEIVFDVVATIAFKKDKKRYNNNPKKIEKVLNVIDILQRKGVDGIPAEMKPHYLKGKYKGCLECHIEPDLLIIWLQYDEEQKRIVLTRLGSHSELFKK